MFHIIGLIISVYIALIICAVAIRLWLPILLIGIVFIALVIANENGHPVREWGKTSQTSRLTATVTEPAQVERAEVWEKWGTTEEGNNVWVAQ